MDPFKRINSIFPPIEPAQCACNIPKNLDNFRPRNINIDDGK